jgi:transcriptional regulator with XRE-family HTH domain
MTICERLFLLLGEKRGQQELLAAHIGVAPTTITNWKKRNTDPPAKLIVPICDFLDCSTDFLLTSESSTLATKITDLSVDGVRVGKMWDGLDERSKTIVMAKIYERQEAMAVSAECAAPTQGLLKKEE